MPKAALCIAAAATAALVSSKCDLPALAVESMLITFVCHTAQVTCWVWRHSVRDKLLQVTNTILGMCYPTHEPKLTKLSLLCC